jgi:hypothetical protein
MQRQRALVLLVREALRYAESIGVRQVRTEAPERLVAFAARMCGFEGERAGDRRTFAGALYAARSAALAVSDEQGRLHGAGGVEEEAEDAAVDVRD